MPIRIPRFVTTISALVASCAALASAAPPADVPHADCAALRGADVDLPTLPPARVVESVAVGDDLAAPAHCRVRAYVAPRVQLLVWLPERWSGRLVMLGCGGKCGNLEAWHGYGHWRWPLRRGDAVAFTDMGHVGRDTVDALWAAGDLAARVDFGFRATHVATAAAKAIVAKRYGRAPSYSYLVGNSTGGRQGLTAAQRFPEDFDGIVAKCPLIDDVGTTTQLVWTLRALARPDGRAKLDGPAIRALHAGALRACDAADGHRDGVVDEPLNCRFDPGMLACGATKSAACLTPDAVDAARRVYAGPVDSRGRPLHAGGFVPGSELTWLDRYVTEDGRIAYFGRFLLEVVRYQMFERDPGPGYTLEAFDFDEDPARMRLSGVLTDASQTDLERFRQRGGKLLLLQGGADSVIAPASVVRYYEAVERTMGGPDRTREFARLFVLPGVDHCFAGPGRGADVFDSLDLITRWVEQSAPPDRIVAQRLKRYADPWPELNLPVDDDAIEFTREYRPYPARPGAPITPER
jgi:feruloyl esterase